MRSLLTRAGVVAASTAVILGLSAPGAGAAVVTGPKPGKVTWNARTNVLAAYNYKNDGWAVRASLTRFYKNSAFTQTVTDWSVDGKRQAIRADVTNGKVYYLKFCYTRWEGKTYCSKSVKVRG